MFIKKALIAAVVVFVAYGFSKPSASIRMEKRAFNSQDTIIKDSIIQDSILVKNDSLALDSLTSGIDSTKSSTNLSSLDSLAQEEAVDSSKLIFGTASYYHDMFIGRKTANGQIFSQNKMTCAHRTIPLGKYVLVTNLRNNKTVKLLVNDRMGKSRHEIDLTTAAAKKLGFIVQGWTPVRIEILD